MDINESLFSLELHVENINRLKVPCVIPAVSFRLLDFPTLILHHLSPASVQKLREKSQVQGITKDSIEAEFRDRHGNISFSKGKSCLFRANIENLQSKLQETPLYVMLLDVWHKKPKLVASTMIPLKKTIDKIAADVEQSGISVPTISQQEGLYQVYNLMGTVVGTIKLCLRLLSLGGCLASHISAKSIIQSDKKPEQKKTLDDKGSDIILEDLEVIDEEPSSGNLPPTVQCTATQTNKQAPEVPVHKPVMHTSPPYMEDIESETAIISNTVCPPPLYYHVMSHAENIGKTNETRTMKETKFDDSSLNIKHDVDFVYYKPDLVQPDGSCGCASVSVQTDSNHDLTKRQKPTESPSIVHAELNSNDLPLLTALLEELSFLRMNRKENAKVPTPIKKEVSLPKPNEQRLRECCSTLVDKKLSDKSKKVKPSVLMQKRVKFKQTNLKYGMTKTQLLRLEMNQKIKHSSRRDATSNRKDFPSQELTQPEKKSSDLGRTHTVFHRPFIAEQQNRVTAETQTEEGVDETRFSELKKDDTMRPDSVDSSSRCLSSPNSVEIFLPQMEGESDGSDVFDVTALDAEDRFAPHLTYNKYGHTGIPDIPECASLDHPYSTHIPDQSEPTDDQSNLSKNSDLSDLHKKSPDQSEGVKSSPISTPSPRKTPDLTRRRSITSQTAKSRTSTALSMYSDDFEECPVWETPNPSGYESSDSISHSSYHSMESQGREAEELDNNQPVKSYYSPLKSGKNSNSASEESPPPQDHDSRDKQKNVLQLPKPGNDLGYTF